MNTLQKTAVALTAIATSFIAVAETAEDLNLRFAGNGRVSFKSDANGDPIAVMKDANGTCEVMLRGAHVTACAFAGDAHPLLYVPHQGYVGKPTPRSFIHGGVPLLWPWFGSSGAPQLSSWRSWLNKIGFSYETEAPFHATARYSLFSVKKIENEKTETVLTLVLRPCDEVSEYTPGDFELEYRIALGAHSLGLRLTTKNVGDGTFRYREGYHPYFHVSDCYAVVLAGVDGCEYESSRDLPYDVDHIWKGKVPEWPGCDLFKFKEEKSVITLEDPAWKRDIVLTTTGARDVVTWCQDVKGAAKGTMNIDADECRDYFCIEPSNFYAESEIALEKDQSHTFETVITIKSR